MAQFDAQKDYYSTLGAEHDSTPGEIERLYKRLARCRHPDCGGDEEEMKALNEAYMVLRDEARRRAYDAERLTDVDESFAPFTSPSAQADAASGQCVGAMLTIGAGLFLLLLVRFQWMWFLWPLVILSSLILVFGVLMARGAMLAARERFDKAHPIARHTRLQEVGFWSLVCAGGYGVYLVLTAV